MALCFCWSVYILYPIYSSLIMHGRASCLFFCMLALCPGRCLGEKTNRIWNAPGAAQWRLKGYTIKVFSVWPSFSSLVGLREGGCAGMGLLSEGGLKVKSWNLYAWGRFVSSLLHAASMVSLGWWDGFESNWENCSIILLGFFEAWQWFTVRRTLCLVLPDHPWRTNMASWRCFFLSPRWNWDLW